MSDDEKKQEFCDFCQLYFEMYWHNTGSGISPIVGEELSVFSQRVSADAFDAGFEAALKWMEEKVNAQGQMKSEELWQL